MLRGKDPGIYFNTTTGAGGVSSAGVDVGCSVGRGYYLGDPRKMTKSTLGGWSGSISGGVDVKPGAGGGVNGGVDVGFDKSGKPETVVLKVAASAGVGVATPVQRCSVSPKQKLKERTEVDVYSVAPAIAKYPCSSAHVAVKVTELYFPHLCHSTNINVSMIKKMSYQKMFLVPISYIGWNNYIRLY